MKNKSTCVEKWHQHQFQVSARFETRKLLHLSFTHASHSRQGKKSTMKQGSYFPLLNWQTWWGKPGSAPTVLPRETWKHSRSLFRVPTKGLLAKKFNWFVLLILCQKSVISPDFPAGKGLLKFPGFPVLVGTLHCFLDKSTKVSLLPRVQKRSCSDDCKPGWENVFCLASISLVKSWKRNRVPLRISSRPRCLTLWTPSASAPASQFCRHPRSFCSPEPCDLCNCNINIRAHFQCLLPENISAKAWTNRISIWILVLQVSFSDQFSHLRTPNIEQCRVGLGHLVGVGLGNRTSHLSLSSACTEASSSLLVASTSLDSVCSRSSSTRRILLS